MRRQLQANGGITNARQGYGAGSWVKEKFRKLIPNELANIAVKAAPFVAPFNPGIAGLMRGIGRFDQRGSLSDAMKQGLLTTAGGAGARYLGGQRGMEDIMGGGLRGGFTNPISSDSPLRDFFKSRELSKKEKIAKEIRDKKSMQDTPDFMQRATKATIGKVPILEKLPPMVQQQLLIGGVTAGASALASFLAGDFRPQEPGESIEEYLAARKKSVGKQMRTYMDNYFTYDPEYSALDDAGKDAFVARYNVNQGGRVGYQTGGISMANTLAQNRAINNAQRAANQAVLQGGRNTQQATGILDAAMRSADPNDPGGSLTNIYNKYFHGKNTGVPAGTFNMGNRKMSYTSSERDNIIRGIASQLGNQTVSQTNTAPTFNKQASIDAAAAREAKAKAYYQALEQKQLEAYGRGVKTMPEFIGGDPYKAEAATLGGMNPGAYMDYLLTGDPQDLRHKYYKDVDGIPNPNYDPQFASYDDIYGTMPRNPYDVYYEQQLQRQIDAGIPEAERIQKGQVMGMPGAITTGTTGTVPSLYESYADALARTKAAMGLRSGGRVGYAIGSPEKQMEAGAPPIIYEGNMDPRAQNQQVGLPSIPGPIRMARDGPEFDMRQRGGFQPLGRQEGKDDVPAMLAKNEFVMTADAVRAAGGGSIKKGAQRMYDTMKKLERRVS